MELIEFIEVTKRAEKIFDKVYKNDQLEIMFEELKDLSKETYAKAIKHCINNCKYLPKIADIRAFTNENRPSYKDEQENIEYIDCKRCNKGFIRYYKSVDAGDGRKIKYEYIALCTCENGTLRQQQGYNLPVAANVKAENGEIVKNFTNYRNNIEINRNIKKLAGVIK